MAHGCNYIAAFVNNNNVTFLVITFISMKYKTVVTNNQKKNKKFVITVTCSTRVGSPKLDVSPSHQIST